MNYEKKFPFDYQSILNRIDEIDPVAYARTRNHLGGSITALSPYITRGVITLPFIRDCVLKRYTLQQSEKFIQELAWREYFQSVWQEKGDAIFEDLRFSQDNARSLEIIRSIEKAETGINIIDQSIRELYTTGYVHNHMRMWLAMLSCNVGKVHWYQMSRWMYYHLYDGDLASNMLSWQWVAGTSRSKKYVAHQELINACTGSDQRNTFLDISRDQVGLGGVPEVLQKTNVFEAKLSLPTSENVVLEKDKTLLLYHPWHLDPSWRNEIKDPQRILVIEPSHFEKFPVSKKVMDFIVNLARSLFPDITIYVGEVHNIPDIHEVDNIYTRDHQLVKHFPGIIDQRPQLFPEIPRRYYPNFFSYWKLAQKYHKVS